MFLRHLNHFSSPIECRKFKCATDWGLVASAGGGLIGGIIDAIGARGTNHIQWRRTQGLQNDEQEFQAEQAELERQWQEEMQNKYNDWQEGMYLKYQSPQALRQQYEAAGLNPFMADTDARALASTSPVTAPQGAAAHGAGTPSLGSGHTSSVDFARNFSTLAEGLQKLASAKATGIDTSIMEQAASDIIRKYKLDADGQELVNNINKDMSDFVTYNGGKFPKAKYDLLLSEIVKATNEAKSSESESDYKDTLNEIQKILKPVYSKDAAVADGVMTRITEYVNNIFRMQNMEIETGYTNAAANTRQAAAAEEQVSVNRMVGKSIVTLNDAIASYNKALTRGQNQQNMLFDATRQEQITAAFERLEQVGIVSKQMTVALQMAMKDRDWQQVEKILHAASTTASTLRDLGIGFSQISGSMPKSRNPIGFGAYGQ